MIIDIFQDTVCPWCRVGKKRLFNAINKWSGEPITIRYRSFLLKPEQSTEPVLLDEYMLSKMGDPRMVRQAHNQVTMAGESEGLIFRFDRIKYLPNTLASHQLIKLAPEERVDEIVDSVYQAYFEIGFDIGNIDVLADIASKHGMDKEQVKQQLSGNIKLAEVEADLALAKQLQISGVPFFIFDGKSALSGAQPTETFLQALQKVTEQE